jgi:hypothetical protein
MVSYSVQPGSPIVGRMEPAERSSLSQMPPVDPILRQFNPLHNLTHYPKITFYVHTVSYADTVQTSSYLHSLSCSEPSPV